MKKFQIKKSKLYEKISATIDKSSTAKKIKAISRKPLYEKSNAELPYENCLNCETPLLGEFCYVCGQKTDVAPYTVKTLLSVFYKSFRKFDAEVKNTFLALLFRPGEFCRDYLAGKRKPYVDPIKYFFLSFVFYLSVLTAVSYISQNPEIDESAIFDTKMELVVLGSVIFWVISLTLVFRRDHYNFVEKMVCLIFLTSQTRVFTVVIRTLIMPLTIHSPHEKLIQACVPLLLSVIYLTIFCRDFYKESFVRLFFKVFLVVLIFLIQIVLAAMLYVAIKDFPAYSSKLQICKWKSVKTDRTPPFSRF